jgi:hypothetical protein
MTPQPWAGWYAPRRSCRPHGSTLPPRAGDWLWVAAGATHAECWALLEARVAKDAACLARLGRPADPRPHFAVLRAGAHPSRAVTCHAASACAPRDVSDALVRRVLAAVRAGHRTAKRVSAATKASGAQVRDTLREAVARGLLDYEGWPRAYRVREGEGADHADRT